MPGKVLVVDDSPTMRRIVANTLKRIGFSDLEEAENGQQALILLSGNTFDLIVTDWNMPGMSGLEFIKSVRSDSSNNLPILMVTTRSEADDVKEALKAGANSYIVKPFTPKVLKEKINSII